MRKAIREALGSGDDRWVLVHTFAEAAEKLLGYLPEPVTPPGKLVLPAAAATPRSAGLATAPAATAAPPAPPSSQPALVLDQAQLKTIGKVFQEMAHRILDIEEALARHRREKGCPLDVPRVPHEHMDVLASVVLYGETKRIRLPEAFGFARR